MSKRAALATVVLLAFASLPSFGWWETGHRVIARIAADHLTLQARARVALILGVARTRSMLSQMPWPKCPPGPTR